MRSRLALIVVVLIVQYFVIVSLDFVVLGAFVDFNPHAHAPPTNAPVARAQATAAHVRHVRRL